MKGNNQEKNNKMETNWCKSTFQSRRALNLTVMQLSHCIRYTLTVTAAHYALVSSYRVLFYFFLSGQRKKMKHFYIHF